jgi:hypothetical protein
MPAGACREAVHRSAGTHAASANTLGPGCTQVDACVVFGSCDETLQIGAHIQAKQGKLGSAKGRSMVEARAQDGSWAADCMQTEHCCGHIDTCILQAYRHTAEQQQQGSVSVEATATAIGPDKRSAEQQGQRHCAERSAHSLLWFCRAAPWAAITSREFQ